MRNLNPADVPCGVILDTTGRGRPFIDVPQRLQGRKGRIQVSQRDQNLQRLYVAAGQVSEAGQKLRTSIVQGLCPTSAALP